jgi:hypothetical protein
MSLATAHDFGVEFAEAIGLPTENLMGYVLESYTGNLVVIKARYYVHGETVAKVYNLARNYQLVEAE